MSKDEYAGRVSFDPASDVMDVDFSDFTFTDAQVVDDFYDEIEAQLEASGKQWFFVVNYRNCRIFDLAWIPFSLRGKRVNIRFSLGTVRYAAREETVASIEKSAENAEFDPNLFPTRDAALEKVAAMKAESAAEA